MRQNDVSSEPTPVLISARTAAVTPKGSKAKLENGEAVDRVSTLIGSGAARENFEMSEYIYSKNFLVAKRYPTSLKGN